MLRRIALSLLLALSLTLGWVTVALASWPEITDVTCNWSYSYDANLSLTYRWGSTLNGYYQNIFYLAASSWQATATPVWMTRVVAGGQILTETYYDGNEPVHRLGYTYQPWCIPYVTHLSSATSYINRYYTHDPSWSDHEVQQLAAHELGHAIGLYHIKDSFTDYAVMRGSIILGDSYWTPRPWDVTFVNCVYPNHRPC